MKRTIATAAVWLTVLGAGCAMVATGRTGASARGSASTVDEGTFAPYRPLEFSVRGPFCSGEECRIHPDLAALQFTVKKVRGTSPEVAEGERYLIEGNYELSGETPFVLSIAVFTTSFGASEHLSPGEGRVRDQHRDPGTGRRCPERAGDRRGEPGDGQKRHRPLGHVGGVVIASEHTPNLPAGHDAPAPSPASRTMQPSACVLRT